MHIGFIYALGSAILWGLVYTLDQKILSQVSPSALLVINALVTALVMIPYIVFIHVRVRTVFTTGTTNLWLLILLSIILTTLANFLLLSAVKSLDASYASMLQISYPFFVVLFSLVLFGTSPNMYFFLGGILMFLGSVVIIRFA